ncbi:MAG: hypothetical protein LBB53_00905, partial [Prevotellaceae bacterium]|jgi:hypothetical protein|nr:hypothetical protein [Prevotellaceae bacterium]
MKNFKYLISISVLLTVVVISVFVACKKTDNNYIQQRQKIVAQQEQQIIDPFFSELESNFNRVGVEVIYQDYKLTQSELKEVEAKLAEIGIEGIKSSISDKKIRYKDGTNVYVYYANENLATYVEVSRDCDGNVGQVSIQELDEEESQITLKIFNKENYSTNFLLSKDGTVHSLKQNISGRYEIIAPQITGDCNETGPRRPGESFNSCFMRNWNNFCCEIISCIAIATNPQYVAFVIGLVCSCQFK